MVQRIHGKTSLELRPVQKVCKELGLGEISMRMNETDNHLHCFQMHTKVFAGELAMLRWELKYTTYFKAAFRRCRQKTKQTILLKAVTDSGQCGRELGTTTH